MSGRCFPLRTRRVRRLSAANTRANLTSRHSHTISTKQERKDKADDMVVSLPPHGRMHIAQGAARGAPIAEAMSIKGEEPGGRQKEHVPQTDGLGASIWALQSEEPQSAQAVKSPKKKRKAIGSKSATPDNKQLLDADFIRATMPYPSQEQYASAPKHLFGSDPVMVAQAMRQTMEAVDSEVIDQIQTQFTYSSLVAGKRKGTHNKQDTKWACRLTVNVPANIGYREVVGEGYTQKFARASAWVHLVSRLHSDGDLSSLFTGLTATPPVAKKSQRQSQTTKEEPESIVDIYNYVAGSGLMPRYQAYLVGNPRKRSVVRVNLGLPEWEIQACGLGQDVTSAEASAILDFKAQAEAYHRGDEFVSLRNMKITAQNAKRIVDLHSSSRPAAKIHIEHRELQIKESWWQASLSIDNQPIGQSIPRRTKDQAEEMMYLSAAVHLVQQDPALYVKFDQPIQKKPEEKRSSSVPPVKPINVFIERYSESVMLDSLQSLNEAGLPRVKKTLVAEEGYEPQNFRRGRKLDILAAQQRNEELKKKVTDLREDKLQTKSRAQLPMTAYRSEVVDMVSNNPFSIVVGSTGSGKTTQVPQIILDDKSLTGVGAYCNIVCTQPRRIAATSVARRVAAERGEQIGDTVGYHVRFDAQSPRNRGSISYCTTGILLEQLKHAPDEVMDNVSHIIVDEVHERDMLIDFLMINLKSIIQTRRNAGKIVPKVILMSATLDTQLFANYFSDDGQRCPSINVPGRTFPVKEFFLADILQDIEKTYPGQRNALLHDGKGSAKSSDIAKYLKAEQMLATASEPRNGLTSVDGIDWKNSPAHSSDLAAETLASEQLESFVPIDLVAATIGHICKNSGSGAILVFLPGLEEILKTNTALELPIYGCQFGDRSKYRIHMLHSTVPREAQEEVFAPVADGCRKIILSTNIAETSVTIPDVRYVVDTGKLRESRYDQTRRLTRLQTVWVSRSNIRQRAGRAGRVQDGNYFALFSKERYETLSTNGLPELLRSDLQETCLAVKAQRFEQSVENFLEQAIEPPAPVAIRAAVAELKSLEAFTADERLTDLGRILSRMPIHPSLGKMIVLGIIFRCLDPMLLLGAASEERSIFARPVGERQRANEARKAFAGLGSDQLSFLQAFNEMRTIRDKRGLQALWTFSQTRFLHVGAFQTIERCAQQIEEVLADAGLVPRSSSRISPARSGMFGGIDLNTNSQNQGLIRALLVAGFNPNLAVKASANGAVFKTSNESAVYLHPSSLNHINTKKGSPYPIGTLFAYSSLAKAPNGKDLFFRDSTQVTPLLAILFGGHLRLDGNVVMVDDWLTFRINGDDDNRRAAKALLEFRKARDRLLSIAFQSLTRRQGDAKQPYLADIPLIDIFAKDLLDLLEQEYLGNQPLLST